MILATLIGFVLHAGTGSCAAYALQGNSGAGWVSRSVWAGPGPALTPKLPAISESGSDTFYVSLTQSGVATVLRVACVSASGDTGTWSPLVAVLPAGSFSRDTTCYAWRSLAADHLAGLARGGATTQLAWTAPDSLTVETLDAEQARRKARHCRACGYWWARGVRQVCP